ncbi:hypothetical protein Golob_011972 [Gossypium lobatum]|uniref:Uncharacterized protein n=1 Tax=Gossypium lobatum TaxID=34289 RepID=A0A7J8MR63_9ROSI|nr:hypothetical protein [Gossypium lobatum]
MLKEVTDLSKPIETYGRARKVENKLTRKNDTFEAVVSASNQEIVELKRELKISKVFFGNGMLASRTKQQAKDVPKPKEFNGARSMREMVLWVNIVAMYFTKVTLLWWHRRSTNLTRGETEVGTWVEFQKEFNAQF